MIGIGLQKLGISPAGIGEPEVPPEQPRPGTGAPDLSSGNYAISSKTGDVARTTVARHRVWMLLATRLKSATVKTDVGIVWPAKLSGGYEFEHRAAIQTAIFPATKDGTVRLDDIEFVRSADNHGRVSIWIHFTDLSTNTADKVGIYASGN